MKCLQHSNIILDELFLLMAVEHAACRMFGLCYLFHAFRKRRVSHLKLRDNPLISWISSSAHSATMDKVAHRFRTIRIRDFRLVRRYRSLFYILINYSCIFEFIGFVFVGSIWF